MQAADLLCDSLFRWLENRKKCAEKLLELAHELENVHLGSNVFQVVGTATSVASISAATILTFITGGLASPLLATAVAGTLAGTAVSVTSTLVEAGISSITFKKAIELIKEDEKVGTGIQKLLQDLKDRCGETQLGAYAEELECEVATLLMWALAKRNSTLVPLDYLRSFNRAMFFRHTTSGGLGPDKASFVICQAVSLVCLTLIAGSLKVSAKGMVKNMGLIGMKAAAKAGTKVLGVIGFGICLYDLIVKSEELVRSNQVTKASKFLRHSAREILEGRQKLKEQLDAMQEIIQKLFILKSLEDLGGYSLSMTESDRMTIAYFIKTCTDRAVVSWLQEVTHQIEFMNLQRFIKERLCPILEDLAEPCGSHIDIVFVAHGRIEDHFMPARSLVPVPSICDTILYSPWNCAIDSHAAYAIAQGIITVANRKFCNMYYCEPDPLPYHWNSMKRSHQNIPLILLSPVTPEGNDYAWSSFNKIAMNRMQITDRVIIPYCTPIDFKNPFGEIPLFILIAVTSFVLSVYKKTATIHLSACLSKANSSEQIKAEWRRQYAYTSDGTYMTVNIDNRYMNCEFFRALGSLFDRNLQ